MAVPRRAPQTAAATPTATAVPATRLAFASPEDLQPFNRRRLAPNGVAHGPRVEPRGSRRLLGKLNGERPSTLQDGGLHPLHALEIDEHALDDQVERLSGEVEHRERREQAHRHRHSDHRHRAPFAQEEEEPSAGGLICAVAGRGRRESCTGGYVKQEAVHPAYRPANPNAWFQPTAVVQPRFVRFNLQADF